VFLECKNEQGRTLVARLDCTGYPHKPPRFVFVDPSTHMPSAKRADWPLEPAPGGGKGGPLHICMRAPMSYTESFGTIVPRYSLCQLVEVLILLSKGQGHILREGARR